MLTSIINKRFTFLFFMVNLFPFHLFLQLSIPPAGSFKLITKAQAHENILIFLSLFFISKALSVKIRSQLFICWIYCLQACRVFCFWDFYELQTIFMFKKKKKTVSTLFSWWDLRSNEGKLVLRISRLVSIVNFSLRI